MKGDFSRIRFTPNQHFTSVLQQQGRVSLDADANEQCAIDEYLHTTQIIDTIGAVGGPIDNAGFAITVEGSTIRISRGRYYVQGLLCEASATDYMDQPYLIAPSMTDTEYLEELAAGTIDAICVELQVWQRLITALDDPCLIEPALGQADTTVRLQTVWRVIASAIQPAASTQSSSSSSVGFNRNIIDKLTLLTASDTSVSIQQRSAQATSIEVSSSSRLTRTGRLCVQLSKTGDDCSCQPIPPAGYQGLENQLYRIEIHQPGDETTATFKWSRENASIVAAVISASGTNPQTISVDSLGKDANLGFAPNQWVEITDDASEFGDVPNLPGQLCQISSISAAGQPPSITFTTTVPAVDPAKNARVRRWDQPGTGIAGDMPLSVSAPVDIENGIQVTFTTGNYKSGDYWLIPARTASGTIDWPPCGSDGRPCQPAANIPVYKVPLALITKRDRFVRNNPVSATGVETTEATTFDNAYRQPLKQEDTISINIGQRGFVVQDLRSLFTPLSSTALHVNLISWANDDVITLDQLALAGLKLRLDNTPSSLIDASVFRVTMEIPEYTNVQRESIGIALERLIAAAPAQPQQPVQILNAPRLRTEFVIDGVVSVLNEIVSWQLMPQSDSSKIVTLFGDLLFLELNTLLQAITYAPDPTWYARVRVRLPGHMIYTQASASSGGCGLARTLFLDGQCFAVPGTRQDQTSNIGLQFPSGNGAKASDFESWFYLAPAPTIAAVAFNPANITLPGGAPTGTTTGYVTLGTPASVDTIVTLTSASTAGLTTSIPATITVLAGQRVAIFTVNFTVTAPTAAAGIVCTVTAAIAWKVGAGSSGSGSFTVIAPNM